MSSDGHAGTLSANPRSMTAEEYFQMPEGPPYFQLIEGELFRSPSSFYFHQRIALHLVVSIENYLAEHPIGQVMMAPSDVQLDAKNVFQPDLYFVRSERLHIIDRQGPKGVPDLAVEVISTGTGGLDRGPKKAAFAKAGLEELWIVLPVERAVEVWRLADSVSEPARRLEMGETLTSLVFPGWAMPLSKIFAE